MNLQRVVVATDESDAGRWAVRAGLDLATRASARLTLMRTEPIQARPMLVGARAGNHDYAGAPPEVEMDRLRQWLEADVLPPSGAPDIELAITYGVPGVEICRFAEMRRADLLILGRKQRSQATRILLGDTADAVARRSRVPCLFVHPGTLRIGRVLAALDGSERGHRVLVAAQGFAASCGAELRAMTVEPRQPGEPDQLAAALPLERSARLQARIHAMLGTGTGAGKLEVRRGPIVEEILAAVDDAEADALVIGYHRGGPPGVLEAGSTARRIAHAAPCAVLTVPL